MYHLYVVAALPNGSFKFFATKTSKNLTAFIAFPIGAYLSNVSSDADFLLIDLVESPDFDTLPSGTGIYSGYGTDGQEMINAGRYRLRYVV